MPDTIETNKQREMKAVYFVGAGGIGMSARGA